MQCQAPDQHRHVSCKGPLTSADYPGPCLPFQVKAQASSGDTASQQLLQRDLPSVVKALARELGAGGKSAKVKVRRSWWTGSCVGLVSLLGRFLVRMRALHGPGSHGQDVGALPA